MKFFQPAAEELSHLRADPVLWDQEIDVRPDVAEAIERAAGMRAGRVYWRSAHDHLYALELADLGRGRPSMAMVYGFWDRFEPRPAEHEIDLDLRELALWVADSAPSLDPPTVHAMLQGPVGTSTWAPGSILRTPAERFARVTGFSYEPKYVEIEDLKMAYVEQGAGDAILMLHGVPAWGYLYRRMIPVLARTGRAMAPDLIGFGRSDKPAAPYVHSGTAHVRWMRAFIEKNDLNRITLVGHGWGGMVGLRVVAEMPQRFRRLVLMNTDIADGTQAAAGLRRSARRDVAVWMKSSGDDAEAYRAPFPSREFEAAVRGVPRLMPVRANCLAAYQNRVAIERLRGVDLPVLLAAGDWDAGEAHLRQIFKRAGPTLRFAGGGEFLPEEHGEEIAAAMGRMG